MDRRAHPNDVVTPRRSFSRALPRVRWRLVSPGSDLRRHEPRPALMTGRTGLANSRDGTVKWWMPTRRTMGFRSRLLLRSWRQTDQRARASSRRPRWWSCATRPSRSALDHTMWQKYRIGQSLSILDPETKAPAVKNPFLQPKPGVLTVDEMAIDRVLADGAVIGACNIALKVLSGKLAQNAGLSAEEAAKEWAANIIPGITVIPSGTWGLNRAQEHGCTYCAGG